MKSQTEKPTYLISKIVLLIIVSTLTGVQSQLTAQSTPQESDYYPITSMNIPDEIVLEASGLTFNDEGQLVVTTSRGEGGMITNPERAEERRVGAGGVQGRSAGQE